MLSFAQVAKRTPKTVCQNIAPARLPSFLSRQPEIVYHSQRRALDEDMDDELDFGDILPAPGGGTNAHDDTPGAGPEYLADQRGADVRPIRSHGATIGRTRRGVYPTRRAKQARRREDRVQG